MVKRNPELRLGVFPQVLLDEGGSKTVKTGGHRRMGGKEIAGSCDRERDFERPACLLHEVARTFQDGKGRVSFIEVTDLRLESECAEQPPSADPEQQFLLEAQLRSEEHTSELQSLRHLVCRLLLEKTK